MEEEHVQGRKKWKRLQTHQPTQGEGVECEKLFQHHSLFLFSLSHFVLNADNVYVQHIIKQCMRNI